MKLIIIAVFCVLGLACGPASAYEHHRLKDLEDRIAYLEQNCISPKAPFFSFADNSTAEEGSFFNPQTLVNRVIALTFGTEEMAIKAYQMLIPTLRGLPCFKEVSAEAFQTPGSLAIELFNLATVHASIFAEKLDAVIAIYDAAKSVATLPQAKIVEEEKGEVAAKTEQPVPVKEEVAAKSEQPVKEEASKPQTVTLEHIGPAAKEITLVNTEPASEAVPLPVTTKEETPRDLD